MEKKHRGARSELVATCWLLAAGYEVFRNVSAHGAIDVIATKGDEVLYLDIKTGHSSPRGRFDVPVPSAVTSEHRERGLKFLMVSHTDECAICDLPTKKEMMEKCQQCGKSMRSNYDRSNA